MVSKLQLFKTGLKKFLALTHGFYNWNFNHNGQDKNVPSQIKPIYATNLIRFDYGRDKKMIKITNWCDNINLFLFKIIILFRILIFLGFKYGQDQNAVVLSTFMIPTPNFFFFWIDCRKSVKLAPNHDDLMFWSWHMFKVKFQPSPLSPQLKAFTIQPKDMIL